VRAEPESRLVRITRRGGGRVITALANLGSSTVEAVALPGREIFNSEAPRYGGREDGESAGTMPAGRTLLPGHFLICEIE
jgi:hypothetical protein